MGRRCPGGDAAQGVMLLRENLPAGLHWLQAPGVALPCSELGRGKMMETPKTTSAVPPDSD